MEYFFCPYFELVGAHFEDGIVQNRVCYLSPLRTSRIKSKSTNTMMRVMFKTLAEKGTYCITLQPCQRSRKPLTMLLQININHWLRCSNIFVTLTGSYGLKQKIDKRVLVRCWSCYAFKITGPPSPNTSGLEQQIAGYKPICYYLRYTHNYLNPPRV